MEKRSRFAESEQLPRVNDRNLSYGLRNSLRELERIGHDRDTISWLITQSHTIDAQTKQIAIQYVDAHFRDGYTGDFEMDADTALAISVLLAEVMNFVTRLERTLGGR